MLLASPNSNPLHPPPLQMGDASSPFAGLASGGDGTKLTFAQRKQQNNDAKQQATVGDGKRPATFSYTKDLPRPKDPAFNGINPWSLVINVLDTIDYTKGMLVQGTDMNGTSLTMGDKYFVPSGICHSTKSDAACRGKTRYMYIDNVPSKVMPCANPEMPSDPNCQKNPTGLIAGVVQDAVKMNPFELVASIQGKGSYVNDKCVMRTERVGYQKGGVSNYRYETKCAPPRMPLVCSVQVSDGPKCAVFAMTDADRNADAFAKPNTGVLARMVKETQAYALQFISGVNATPQPDAAETDTPPPPATIDPPKQTRSLPLDPYDRTWTTFCSTSLNTQLTVHYKQATGVYARVSTTGHCLMDRIQCERKWAKYRWYSLVKVNTAKAQYYQIEFYAYIHPEKRYNNYWFDDATRVTGKMDSKGRMYTEALSMPKYTANVEFEGFTGGEASVVTKGGRSGWWDAVLLLVVVLLVVGRGVWRRMVRHG